MDISYSKTFEPLNIIPSSEIIIRNLRIDVLASVLFSSTFSFKTFWDFSMFYQILLSPQSKRWAISTCKNGIRVASQAAERLKT